MIIGINKTKNNPLDMRREKHERDDKEQQKFI
jgi:hypothetical protein